MDDLHVFVRFGSGIPHDIQAESLLAFEKALRRLGVRAEVFLESKGDDSKLRAAMTPQQRAKL